jgi:hypothetical protein
MIKVKVIGGLGNQLFQYATARSLAEKSGKSVVLDVSAFQSYDVHPLRLDKFNCKASYDLNSHFFNNILNIPIIKFSLRRLGMLNNYYFEEGLGFDENLLSQPDKNKLFGYFQTEKYFSSIRQELLKELTLMNELTEVEQDICNQIKNANSVSIHIRRGDYILNEKANNIHGICDSSYFIKALVFLKSIGSIDENSRLFVFSDDIKWCCENLDFGFQTTFVEGSSERPEVDMVLMSRCNHQIISNSTFSWWGAWLNPNDAKVVIAPIKWFQSAEFDSIDIIPESWVKL